jgi:hypothetical protein
MLGATAGAPATLDAAEDAAGEGAPVAGASARLGFAARDFACLAETSMVGSGVIFDCVGGCGFVSDCVASGVCAHAPAQSQHNTNATAANRRDFINAPKPRTQWGRHAALAADRRRTMER